MKTKRKILILGISELLTAGMASYPMPVYAMTDIEKAVEDMEKSVDAVAKAVGVPKEVLHKIGRAKEAVGKEDDVAKSSPDKANKAGRAQKTVAEQPGLAKAVGEDKAKAATFALGLGDMVMKSALNQPLNAEIELFSMQSDDLTSLAVSLGSQEEFSRVGVDRPSFLTDIDFSIQKKANGTSYIKLTTSNRIAEPFLDFVLEVRSKHGRILREFTVLVDPVRYSGELSTPKRIDIPATPKSTIAPDAGSITAVAPPPIPAHTQALPVLKNNTGVSYGPIKRKDTLEGIAQRMRVNESVTINQMMVAIVRANPNAFYNGNINQMKSGYVLRIEDPSIVTNLIAAEADAEMERQRVEWQARKSGRPVVQAAMPEYQVKVATTSANTAQQHLDLNMPKTKDTGNSKAVCQSEFIAVEALDANPQDTEKLNTCITDVQDQLQIMKQFIKLKDQILEMQRQIMFKDKEITALQEPLAVKSAESAQAPEVSSEQVPPEPKKTAELVSIPKPIVPAPAVKEEKSEFLASFLLYGSLGLIVIVVGWVVASRRRMWNGNLENIVNIKTEGVSKTGVITSVEKPVASASAKAKVSAVEDEGPVGSTVIDPVMEAGVYLVYGLHQKAEEILRLAMEETPDRNELKIKMLEVYLAEQNREAFEKEAQEMYAILGNGSDPLWTEVVRMGEKLNITFKELISS
ncbi:type IV pilus assembly protein FimV [Candidatus Methylobacter oryzae]|uniref:FimV N-terminal domain-containing protein n=1 Tax=Candidatus Methylobacter oryzae TaxID=2497749 RepID=A0ABY3CB54_9GAMM|nr:FimV/HubP family polar landmark protein [Candidatus Methylobacter oryzae]TRW96107.1 hypothetical protein EKO24_009210 [Candidatus Methylobacter oryzae]